MKIGYNKRMKCLFLYNPNSGKGKIAKKLGYIEKKLRARYDEVTLCAAAGAHDLEEKVRLGAEKYDAIVFAGGDGTFNNVLHGLAGRDVQLGYIPAGTVNDVARSLGIPRSVRGALKVIAKGNSERLDCMRVNGEHYAMYIAAAGAFTSATYHTSQKKKRAFGALAYAVEGLKHNMKLDVFPLDVKTGNERAETHAVLVLVMNGRSVAGFPVNKDGSMQDSTLETAIIRQAERPNFIRRIGAYFSVASLFVFGCKIRKKDIIYMSGEGVRIDTVDRVVWDFDGEEGICGNVNIEVCPRLVRLFVPKNKKI